MRSSYLLSIASLSSKILASPAPLPASLAPTKLNLPESAEPNSVQLFGWEKCNEGDHQDGSKILEDGWDGMLRIANSLKGQVKFDGQAERDFFGAKEKNTDYQVNIKKMLENTATWTKGSGFFPWSIHMRCDDYKKGAVTDPNEDCPRNTLKQDRPKCLSRCWVPNKSKNPVQWMDGALAYVTNNPRPNEHNPTATINICPGFWKLPKCDPTIDRWSKSPLASEWRNLQNYACQEYALIHELFHIDSNWLGVAPKNGHVLDRKMFVADHNNKDLSIKAYGPYYTKVLANWGGDSVGHLVATNADNLAQYALTKYIQKRANVYADLPTVLKQPSDDPDKLAPHSYLLFNVSGQPTLPSDADLTKGLAGILSSDFTDPDHDYLEMKKYSCSDADADDSCINESTNPGVTLVVDDRMPTSTAGSATTATAIGGPTQCNCDENGCSDDSPPCCKNGTCDSGSEPPTCNCGESGCSADSPACCANGTC